MSETAIATTNGTASVVLEQVVIKGNLADLKPVERVTYYRETCQSLGLNPLTQPFQYITLNGRLTLYATRGATDQLRKIHGVSVTSLERRIESDLYIVEATARDREDREDHEVGAVSIKGLAGEALANAMMKAVTKAKRRVTLSIVGLGWLDESEVDSIPDARPVAVDQETGEIQQEEEPAKPAAMKHTRRQLEDLYDALIDRADVLNIPATSRSTKWTNEELMTAGRALRALIQAKEATIGTETAGTGR